jgi:tetratricopeptide (TPR) repeat protein
MNGSASNARRVGTCFGVLVLLLGLSAWSAREAWAAEEKEKPKARRVLPVRRIAFEALNEAHELIAESRFNDAVKALDRLAGRKGLNAHEQALMFQSYGYVYSGQERYGEAAQAFEKAISTQGLSPPAELSTLYNLGQLLIVSGQHERGIEALERWFASAENPDASVYILMAQAHLQLERYRRAIRWAEEGVAKATKPREAWLQLLLSLYFQTNQDRKLTPVLEQLVTHFPKKRYWLLLATSYGKLGDQRKSLAAFEAAYRQNLLDTSADLVRLAQLYLYHEIPYFAAKVMERGIEEGKIEQTESNWRLLADSWINAREYDRAVEPLGRAAELSSDGRLYVRLGQVYVEREEWRKAIQALRAGLNRGELERTSDAYLLMGICHTNLDDYTRARSAFRRARDDEKTRAAANRWIQHVDSLIARSAALEVE